MSIRKQQVESTLKRAVSQVLARGLSDPRVAGLVSVTRLEVSPDFHDAYVYVSVIPDKYEKRSLAGLRHASAHIHNLVFKAVDLKSVPRLDFRLDAGIKKEAAVLDAIRRGMRHEAEHPVVRPEGAEGSPEPGAGGEDQSNEEAAAPPEDPTP